ncbi:CCR4-NOT transcription complex subunit 7 [Orchesella cincta]|uniref:poly(A)-specific ribonuclease n=1 Tax=Orchesella cincta TaxID=48709 RepID=A0A1D2N4Q0_ORCCI|nr:CCR4-NOT transcription complex subunit 7 [Orchesella cincta]
MVMMGQLMDSERKKQDDDGYILKPPDDYQQQFQANRRNQMERNIQVPTLKSLAERAGRGRRKSGESADDISKHRSPGDEKPDVGKGDKEEACLERVGGGGGQSVRIFGNGDGPQTEHNTVYNIESSCSGRTSSLDSCGGESTSGIGSSLTCSSSASEAVERDALSPSSEQGDDVPDNSNNNNGPCKALLLAEDFKGQMTAAKRFLKMVRDGIKDEDDTRVIKVVETLVSDDESKILNDKSAPDHIGHTSKSSSPILDKSPPCVQEVWANNLLVEFAKIRQVVKTYNFIAMDTEFPGIVVRPPCSVRTVGCVFPYELLKVNVDRLKIIQLGVTFMDRNGNTPPGVCTWQFNFRFSLTEDLYAPDSISLLTRCGIQFEKHAQCGIDPLVFGEYFMSSGMVTSDSVTYLTFHSGFDFGYLIKLLSNLPLPENEEKFFEMMRIYFPVVYDLKFLMKSVDLHGGLQDIANQMGQQRVGTQHQAGSDSLLTGMTFFKLQTEVFSGEIDASKYCGKLYGFWVHAEDGREDGWNEEVGDLIDSTSPKHQVHLLHSSVQNGDTR